MKKIIVGCLLAAFSLPSWAQFEKGKNYINASLSGLNLSYSKNENTRLDLNFTAGRFVTTDWMIYGRLGYMHTDDYNHFTLGAGGRYYIEQNGLYLNLGLQYEHITPELNNLHLTPEIGYAFFINHYLTIEPAVYYNMSLNDFSDGSKVGFRLGLGYYF